MSRGDVSNFTKKGFYIERELDPVCWREMASTNPSANIFHTPEMFRVFEEASRHYPACWAVVDGSGYPLALFLPVRVSILDGAFQRLSTRAVSYGGALWDPSDEGRRALACLLREYKHHGIDAAMFTELRNHTDTTEIQQVLEESGFAFENHLNYLVDLTQSEDELWRRISRSGRRSIRVAEKKGVQIEDVINPEQVSEAYAILRAIYSRVNVPLPDQSLFEAAFRELHPKGMLKLTLARIDGRAIATVFNLIYKDKLYSWYGGSKRTIEPYFAIELLDWNAMRWAKEQGIGVFDFGGAGKPEESYGPRDYKAKFGGELVNYGRNVHVHAPRMLCVSQFSYQLMRKFL